MFKKLIGYLLLTAVTVVTLTVFVLHLIYRPITEGTIYLKNANGEAEVLRELETSIPHVYASSEKMAVYTQGFLHAQERLWQMERMRRLCQGRLSEVFGEKAVGTDKFFRTIGLYHVALEAEKNLDQETQDILQAYADGVNDFLGNIEFPSGQSARLLPPEFYAVQHLNIEPWRPADSLSILKLLNFHLSWNWGQDLMRELLSEIGLEDMIEQIYPFTAEHSHNLVTIIDDEDIKGTKFWSDETLQERYSKATGQQPKLKTQKQVQKDQGAQERKTEEAEHARQLQEQAEKEAQAAKLRQDLENQMKLKEAGLKEEQIRLKKQLEEEKLRLQQEEEQARKKKEEEEKAAAEKQRQEQDRLEKEKQEQERLEKERQEKERQEKERQENERKQKEVEEQKKKEAEELKKKEEEQKKKEEEEKQKKLAEEEEKKRVLAEIEKKQKEEEEAKKKGEQEQEAQRKQKEVEEQKKKQAEEEARKKAEQELQEKKRKEEEEQALKKKQEEEALQKKQQEEAKRLQEEEAKKKQEEEERIKKEQEEQERKKKEIEEAQKKKEAEEKRQKELQEQEEARKQKEAQEKKQKEEEERKKKEEEEKKQKQEAEAKKLREAEEQKQKEQEAKKQKEAEEQKAKEEAAKKKEEEQMQEKKKIQSEGIDQQITLDEPQASNNWVVHGNYTKTGKPLLAGDPHLSNQLPSHWYLMELHFEGKYQIGASHPGIPFVMIGKTQNVAWAVTSALADVSDLYREKLNKEKTKYFVDGEWQDLKIRREQIKVKDQDKPIDFDIRTSHRGPIMNQETLGGAQILFSEGMPQLKGDPEFSFAWSGHDTKENTVKLMRELFDSKSIKEFFTIIDGQDFNSVPQNIILAFNNGDIGYILGAQMPIRKNKRPFSGCRVLDGTNRDNDWIGYAKTTDLPRVANPKKGFIVTANNRIVPEHFITDYGATLTSTVRAQRITELIQTAIDKGHKLDYKDMLEIQNDTVDLMARDMIPFIIKHASKMLDSLNNEQKQNAQIVLNRLAHWHGEMYENSIGASIYAVWQLKLYSKLFTDYLKDDQMRMTLTANYPFNDFLQVLMRELDTDPENQKFNQICNNGYPEYQGKHQCLYLVARSMAEAYSFLSTEVSTNIQDWEWKNIHVNEYPNLPWSLTPFKFIFHREAAVGGNGNTVKVSKYSFKRAFNFNQFKSTHTPNYKQVFSFNEDPHEEVGLYSMDGGQSGNLLAGHYFDFNNLHYNGRLLKAINGKAAVEQVQHSRLLIKPEAMRVEDIEEDKHQHDHSHHHYRHSHDQSHHDHDHSHHDHHHDHEGHHHHHHHGHQHKRQESKKIDQQEKTDF